MLYAVSRSIRFQHDVVSGHALLRGAGGVLLDENGIAISYATEINMVKVALLWWLIFGRSRISKS